MASFPTPFSGEPALYPATVGKRYQVTVHKFDDATEQRYRQSAGVHRLTLTLDGITKSEKDSVVDFFNDSKGSFDATWDITLGGVLYDYMAFADDEIAAVERENGVWSLTVQVVQTRKN